MSLVDVEFDVDELLKGFDEALDRWRDSCLFFFKFDVALAAGVAALASYLKLEGVELLLEIHENRWLLLILSWLILYAIAFEWILTSTRVSIRLTVKEKTTRDSVRVRGRIFAVLFAAQVLGHLLLATGAIAYVRGASDSVAELIKRDCGSAGANPRHPMCPSNF